MGRFLGVSAVVAACTVELDEEEIGDLLLFVNKGLFLVSLFSMGGAGDLDLSLSRANKGFLLSSSSIGGIVSGPLFSENNELETGLLLLLLLL